MITLGMKDENDFLISAALDGENYKLHFSWNDEGFWLMDIRNNAGEDIIRGIKVVPNFPLFNHHRRVMGALPPGEIIAAVVNQSATKNQTIGRNDFISGEFSLIYIPESEVNAILETTV